MDKERKMGVHVEYWLERGIGVKRRIVSLSWRYTCEGGLGEWECMRLIQGTYLPTVYYGLEFIADEDKLRKKIQI